MSIILDNTVGNFAAWQMSIFENASRLKYGQHAIHLSASLGAPIFREPPNADDIAVHGNYEYEHVPDPAVADPQPLLMGIPGRLTISGQTFFRQDTAAHHTEFNKFQQQGLELYEMLFTTISLSSKMLAKTQPTYLVAVQNNCPHILFTTLAASHQRSSATRSLNSLTALLSIRQNGLSHPMLVDHVNNTFDQVILCWQSPTQPGYIAVEDLRAAAYLNALDQTIYAAPKERFLSANPDLRGVNALELQQTFQTYSIALDIDANTPTSLIAITSSNVPYCPLCFQRIGRKITTHGVPGKDACRSGKSKIVDPTAPALTVS